MSKLILAAFLLAAACGLLSNQKGFSGTDDLFDTVLTGDHKIYVLFFYSSSEMLQDGNQELHEHVQHEKEQLVDALQTFDDNVYFAEIDTSKGDFTEAKQAFSLNSENLKTYPATIVLDDSEGIWVSGPNEAMIVTNKIRQWMEDPHSHTFF